MKIRRNRRIQAAVSAMAAATLALSACGGSDSGGNDDEVTIGMVTAEQGALADLGKGFRRGAELAIDEINATDFLGDGMKIVLETREGSEDPQKAISALNQLDSNPQVSAVTCCILTPVGGALKPLAQSKKLPLVVFAATLDGLNEPPYIHRTYLLPQTFAPRLSTEVVETVKPGSVAYAVTSDNDGMINLLKEVRKPYDEAGLEDLGTVEILQEQTNMRGAASSLVNKNPDIIQLQMSSNNMGTLVSDIVELGYQGQIISSVNASTHGTYSASGGALEGSPYPIDFTPVSDLPKAQEFTKAFEEAHGEQPDGWAASGYTSIYFAATGARDIVADGGTVDRESMAEALSAITDFPTVYADDTVMQDGQITSESAGVFATWRDEEPALWAP